VTGVCNGKMNTEAIAVLFSPDERAISSLLLSFITAGMIFTLSGSTLTSTAALLKNGSVHTLGTLSVLSAKAISSTGEFARDAVQE
jgi:hypothetical protein